VLQPRQQEKLAGGTKVKEHAMSEKPNSAIAAIGIDFGKNSFHIVGHDESGEPAQRQLAVLSFLAVFARAKGRRFFCRMSTHPRPRRASWKMVKKAAFFGDHSDSKSGKLAAD
jgi:hypothetical protein